MIFRSVEGIKSFIFEWTNEDELEYKVSVAYKLGNTGKITFINKGTWYMGPEFEAAPDVTYDMRKPEENTINVYGKYLSGKSFSVKINNPDLKAEIVGDIGVEGNLQYIKVKITSTIKDDTLSKITVYQTDDQSQQVIINANI